MEVKFRSNFPVIISILNQELMISDKPYWYRILQLYEKRHYYKNGLTLPFLVGARKKMEPHNPLLSITDFLEELKSSSYSTTLMKCGHIGEYVFGLLDYETRGIREKNKSVYKDFSSIVITDQSFKNILDFNEFSSVLKDLYIDKVTDSTYTKIEGVWSDFDITDNIRLQEVVTIEL